MYEIEQIGESKKTGKKKKAKEILQISDDGICEIVERKLMMAHEWEEKRAKGKRGEQKSESGEGEIVNVWLKVKIRRDILLEMRKMNKK